MRNEATVEAEIQAKGLNAPRLTPGQIDATIVGEDFHVFAGTMLTVCCLTLRNGFTVTGESACASPANFDAELGRKIARDKARNKIWELEGYLLRQRLSEGVFDRREVQARFTVAGVTAQDTGPVRVLMRPVYAKPDQPDHVNTQFWNATPAGMIDMTITNRPAAQAFEEGAEYLVTFRRDVA